MLKRVSRLGLGVLFSTMVLLNALESSAWAQNEDARWQSIGPWGSDLQVLAVAPSNPNVLYAGDVTGAVYRSDDGAKSWQHAQPLPTAVRALAVHPQNPDILLVGADLVGVVRSDSAGYNWSDPAAGLQEDPFVYSLAFDPRNTQVIYAGTFKSQGPGGVYKSTDGGKSWQPAVGGMRDEKVISLAVDPRRGDVVYAGTLDGQDGIYRSNDGGKTWKPINEGLGKQNIFAIAVHPKKTHILYIATSESGIYKSETGGASWRQVNRGLINLDVRSLVIDPKSPETLYACGALGVFKSTDGGERWQLVASGLSNRFLVRLAVDPKRPRNVYAAAMGTHDPKRGSFLGAVFKTENGGESWTWAGDGIVSSDVRTVQFDPYSDEIIYAGTFGRGMFKSTDGGRTWNSARESINIGLMDAKILDLSPDPVNSGTVLAATIQYGIFKTTDWGKRWRPVWNGGRVQILRRHPKQPETVYAASFSQGLLKSEDNGETWQPTALAKSNVFSLEIDPGNPDILYAGVNAPEPHGGVYKSTDAGVSWSRLTNGIENTMVRALAINPQDPAVIYAGTLQGIQPKGPPKLYKSTDSGSTWHEVTGRVFETFALLIDPKRPQTLYAGKLVSGVFRSTDGGMLWQDVNDGLFNSNVLAMAFHPGNPDVVYAGTVKGGLFRRDFSKTAPADAGRVTAVYLQDMPLPDSGAVKIMYGIPDPVANNVKILIWNRDGETVRSFEIGSPGSGRHSITWDGRDDRGQKLPGGIYFGQLIFGRKFVLRKMVLFAGS